MPRPHYSLIICLLTTVFALPVNAATVTWTGATNSDWATGSNWGGTAPTSTTSDIANIPNTATSPILSTAGATATDVRIGSTAAVANLTINGNGVLTDANGYVGYLAGSTSTATVTGSSAQWINNTLLYIGNNGNGTLNVQNGATVSGLTVRIGNGSSSTGTATIDGAGSQLSTTTGTFYVGNSGNGTLNLQNGGKAVAGAGLIAGQAVGKTGTITITGANSQLSVTGSTTIGNNGNATLSILNGGLLTTGATSMSAISTSTSTALVDGTNSRWESGSTLSVGNVGNGTLTISNGGYVSAVTNFYIANNAGSIGTLNMTGGTLTATTLYISNLAGSNGTATISGANSAINASTIYVGTSGTGSLTVQNGASVNGPTLRVGQIAGSTGTLTITGTGSQVAASTISIGNAGNGTLTISNGGSLSLSSTSSTSSIGATAGGVGVVTMSGAGSSLSTTHHFVIGSNGTGTMTATDHAEMNVNGLLYVGNGVGSGVFNLSNNAIVNNLGGARIAQTDTATGTVHMSTGSIWNLGDRIFIGNLGNGTLTIDTGASINTAAQAGIGTSVTGVGQATVTGNTSRFDAAADWYIGLRGNGTLTIADGAVVTTGRGVDYIYNFADASTATINSTSTTYIANEAGSVGTLNIGAAALNAAAAAGTLSTERVQFGAGTGKIVFNHTDTAYNFAPDIIGNGTLQFVAGNTYLTGDNTLFTGTVTGTGTMTVASGETNITTNSSGFAGDTDVTGGILRVNGSLGGTTTVSGTGRLQGNAALDDLVVNSGGTVAPGNSIGTVNTTNVTYNPGSTYEVEVNAAGQSDLINASGTATLNGGTVFAIPFPDFVSNSPYTILTAAGGVTGAFDGTDDDYMFLTSFLTQDVNNVYLTLNANTSALQSAARSPNQQGVASSINDPSLSANGAINALFLSASITDLNNNLDRLSGEIHAGLASTMISDQRLLRDAILRDDFLEGTQALQGASGRLWFHSFGNWTDTQDTSHTTSMDSRTTGFLTGMEKQGEDYHAGIGFGASRTNIKQDSLGAEADANNYHGLAYAGTKLTDKDKVTAGASYTFHDIDTSRNVEVITFSGSSDAEYHAQTGQVFGEIAHDFAPNVNDDKAKAKAELYLQGAYIFHKGEDFTEDGTAGLSGDSEWDNVATSTLGLRLHREIETENEGYFTLLGGLAWQHAYGAEYPEKDMRFNDGSTSFTIEGAPIDRDAVLLNAGIGVYIKPNLSLNISYDGGFSQNTTQHGITGRANWKF